MNVRKISTYRRVWEQNVDTAQRQHTQAAEKTETLPNAEKTDSEEKGK